MGDHTHEVTFQLIGAGEGGVGPLKASIRLAQLLFLLAHVDGHPQRKLHGHPPPASAEVEVQNAMQARGQAGSSGGATLARAEQKVGIPQRRGALLGARADVIERDAQRRVGTDASVFIEKSHYDELKTDVSRLVKSPVSSTGEPSD